MKSIIIKNARIHNLKNFDIAIPKEKLTVITGVSGSGKSSLVFDIIFEEGRRQYLQSLGMFLGIDDQNKFDSISGIGPTIAIQQSTIRQSNPRSTVGSRTNILNMLGILYASEGQISCSVCGTPVNNDLICDNCGNIEERLTPDYFSYNSANGMCIKCAGRGAYFEIDMQKLVPDEHTTLKQIFDKLGITPGYMRLLHRKYENYMDVAFSQIPENVKADIIHGHPANSNRQRQSYCLIRILQNRLYRYGKDPDGFYTMVSCPECNGFRVGEEARRVYLNDKHIGELAKLTITELNNFLQITVKQKPFSTFGENLCKEILRKTKHLSKIRLGYLTLYREIPSLSGGEIQRLYLNTHLESKMDSLIYILDEPTIGLHESEKTELLNSIQALKELGNTVIVVEHDRNTIELAEHIIDIGPKAGIEGGQIIYQGDLPGLLQSKQSLTGQSLSGKALTPIRISSPKTRYIQTLPTLSIQHAKTNNLKDVTVSLPLGALVGIAGVSGSGKSSLISYTLIPLLKEYFREQWLNSRKNIEDDDAQERPEISFIETLAKRLEGEEHLSGFAEVTQAPIGRHINSNPATYIGIWDKIRKLFAQQPQAKQNNLSPGHFSFNSKGACPICGGSGRKTIWLGGNLQIDSICKECNGKRYNDQALSVTYKDKNIVDILEMPISEAAKFFADQRGIYAKMAVLERIGMGYITLGQPAPTLSGGEAQRIKLAREISKHRKGNILYVLDEPTTGLSLHDTASLIQLLDELVEKGNSVLVIEHDPVVLSACDWIIELGPAAGIQGGKIIAQGTPQNLKENQDSLTGPYLSVKKE